MSTSGVVSVGDQPPEAAPRSLWLGRHPFSAGARGLILSPGFIAEPGTHRTDSACKDVLFAPPNI